ncbi:MAG: hypothetical protein PV362_19300 [Providencia heimbachae]|nr:hypothetical protein [Providencia heimbachae]
MELTSDSLMQFFTHWESKSNVTVAASQNNLDDLVDALEDVGVTTVEELIAIVPANYANVLASQGIGITDKPLSISGHIYTWMILKDFRLTSAIFSGDAFIPNNVVSVFKEMMPPDEFDAFKKVYNKHLYK